jgi:hypothetical protein
MAHLLPALDLFAGVSELGVCVRRSAAVHGVAHGAHARHRCRVGAAHLTRAAQLARAFDRAKHAAALGVYGGERGTCKWPRRQEQPVRAQDGHTAALNSSLVVAC